MAASVRAATGTEVASRIDAARQHPEAAAVLVEMLHEQSALYAGRPTNEAERLRGYVLASFETVGLPPAAVPFVLEELETGRNPYTIAAAARALRGATTIPVEAPELLVIAIERLRGDDDIVSFAQFTPAAVDDHALTALGELASTLAAFGPRAEHVIPALRALLSTDGRGFSGAVRTHLVTALDAITPDDRSWPAAPAAGCCGAEEHIEREPLHVGGDGSDRAIDADLGPLVLEDQDGRRLTFAQRFAGRPSAIAFFYTRCTNPEKCSLTVTRLGRLAGRITDEGLDANVAGISYDPRFDRPGRLQRYGTDRGVAFSPRCSLLRTVGPFDPLQEALTLGVGFGPVTVNRHRLDVVILDSELGIAQRFTRRVWHEATVFEALASLGCLRGA